jgi:hypothetical protein
MKRQSLKALSASIGVLVVLAAITAGPVSAAPKSSAQQTVIYSDTFTPVTRFPDAQSLQNERYFDGPSAPPNLLYGDGYGNDIDAFINSPDLTIGPKAMSVVSAEVCLKLTPTEEETSFVIVQFGVQDKDRNVVLWTDPEAGYAGRVIEPTESLQCVTLTFPQPVMLVNHPHLVVAVVVWPLAPGGFVDLDGVAYTLQPTRKGDIAPSDPWSY